MDRRSSSSSVASVAALAAMLVVASSSGGACEAYVSSSSLRRSSLSPAGKVRRSPAVAEEVVRNRQREDGSPLTLHLFPSSPPSVVASSGRRRRRPQDSAGSAAERHGPPGDDERLGPRSERHAALIPVGARAAQPGGRREDRRRERPSGRQPPPSIPQDVQEERSRGLSAHAVGSLRAARADTGDEGDRDRVDIISSFSKGLHGDVGVTASPEHCYELDKKSTGHLNKNRSTRGLTLKSSICTGSGRC
eukprot:CAMPEP_0172537154 /NCGR_PEP_ID=MMETSP1067-20121228/8824_1 /TAXON_ID=265564 ORGANISM="Thalassiosira punctigera, Strain Tpunct2005C2" /NCGR_SAMPLE_ID=MMETSP1067 /ASSEMBLY_ACC=CAM_ASM_000444 /LENGTH=248 /DNA_ID=CAMNT_0013322397 /DNA_START=109 /DNA_END=854 /DNA_ORIENTATION=+